MLRLTPVVVFLDSSDREIAALMPIKFPNGKMEDSNEHHEQKRISHSSGFGKQHVVRDHLHSIP